jgi:PKHD-type hydroxylase
MNINSIVWYLRKPLLLWFSYENVFSDEEIARIISHADGVEVKRGVAYESGTGKPVEKEVRRSDVSWLAPTLETDWLYRKLTDVILSVNSSNFNFNLLGVEKLQFSSYKADELGYFGKHADASQGDMVRTNRKLSFTLQLSDPNTYEGGDVLVYTAADHETTTMTRTKGSMIFFPSNQMHEVTPVTSGVRQSLVGWVIGPEFN